VLPVRVAHPTKPQAESDRDFGIILFIVGCAVRTMNPMPNYRRAIVPGGSYFFTVVTAGRQPILCDGPVRSALRAAIAEVRARWPFTIDAWVLLPDHLHCLWTLPPGDSDHSRRWSAIKRLTSQGCATGHIVLQSLRRPGTSAMKVGCGSGGSGSIVFVTNVTWSDAGITCIGIR